MKCAAYCFRDTDGKLLPETMAASLGRSMYQAGIFVPAYTRPQLMAILRAAYRRGARVVRLRAS